MQTASIEALNAKLIDDCRDRLGDRLRGHVETIGERLARDLAAYGIRVVSIAPGLFATSMVEGLPPKVSQSIIDRMILYPNRMGRPDEFAALVRHIAENSYLNATTINLDAGARMQAR